MGNTLKKIFSSFVALTTIAWSVGIGTLALPSVASAASISAGDLIKASGPAVYFYAADGKRYVFPNEKTYFSWFSDFSSVKTITDDELAAIMIGGNVTIRPGTKLVKITTDPKVYAVTKGGVLHWIESEAIVTSLYGASWAQRVVDVPDGFFVNYSVGSSVSTAVHPDGTLIMYAGDPTRYVVWGGNKRKIASDAAFAANGFQSVFVITTTISYPNGTDVTGREADLADVVAAGGSSTVGGSISAALASDTPAGATVPKNASSVMLAKYNFTAGSANAIITGLRIHRVGVGATTDFANVYLYDANGTRLTTGRTINSTTNMIEFNSLSIAVAAGQTVSLVLTGDVNTSTTGGQHSFELSDAASVVISGSGTVSGSFPIRGNVFTIGTTSAARLDVQKGTTPTNPNIGAMDAEVSNFKLIANTNDIEVRRITLLQAGTVTNTDLTDLKLYQGSTVVATAAALSNDKIVLNFNPPYVITNGTTKTFSLHARIAGRSGRTIRTYVEYTTDVYAIDRTYNSGAAICIAPTAVGGCTAASQGSFNGASASEYVEVTTQGGQLTVSFNGPATQNVAKGTQDVVLYRFSLASPDNTLEIRNIDFKIQGQAADGVTAKVKGVSGTEYFRDIKIKNLDTGATVMGPTSEPSSLASGATDTGYMTLSDSFNMTAGSILNLAITADLSNSEDADKFFSNGTSTYKVILGDGTNIFDSTAVRIVDTGEYLATTKVVPNSNITGNAFTVKASSLTISLASSPSAGTVVKKQANIPAVGFVFTAGAQSDVTIKSVKLTGRGQQTGSYALAELDDVVTSCALFDGDTQVGTSQSPDSTTGEMSLTNMNVLVAKGTSKTLVAKCTADSVVSGTSDQFAVGIAADADVTAEDQDANTVTPSRSTQVNGNAGASPSLAQTVMNSGTITIATDSLRTSTILVGGGDVWQNLAQFKATAQYEDMNLERVAVSSTGEAANFTAIAVAKDGAVKGWDTLPAGFDTVRDIDMSSSPIVVPKNGSATFQLWGKLANVQASSSVSGATSGVARSGATLALGIGSDLQTGEWDSNYDNQFNVKVTGVASGERVYATTTVNQVATSGNTFVLRKTKPTVTRQALSTTTLASGITMDLYKFQVSADSAGSLALKKFVFDYSKNADLFKLTNFRVRRGSSDMALADVIITSDSQTGNGDLEAGEIGTASTTGQVNVAFTNEETVSGSGNVYTLYATISGTVNATSTISFTFNRVGNTTVVTGYLDDDIVSSQIGPNIDTISTTGPDGAANVKGTFLWSDMSEVPHTSSVDTASSFDWTNDVYVEDLTPTQVLSR